MKILILGGTQFVSYHFTKRFAEDEYEVYTLNRGNKKAVHNSNIKEIYADRHSLQEMKTALQNYKFDYIVDVSAYTLSDVEILYNAIEKESLKGYIFVSSSAVYKESEIFPIDESFPVGENRFWGDYGTNKLEAEKFLMNKYNSENFPVTILRPPYIYGEGNNVYREGFIFDRLSQGKPIVIPNKGKTIVQFIHIEDLYQTVKKIIEKNIFGKTFNVGNYEAISFRGWIEKCMRVFGKTTEIIEFNYEENNMNERDFFPFYDYQYYLDVREISKIHKCEIGLEDGLKRAFEWYKLNKDDVAKRTHYSENSDKIELGEFNHHII